MSEASDNVVDAPAPWLRADLLPAKPDADSHGYLFRKVFTRCSRDELIDRCRQQALLVWAPEVERLVPAIELPFLHGAIRECTQKKIRENLKLAGFYLLIYGLPLFIPPSRGRGAFEFQFLLLLSFAVLPLVEGWWQLRQLDRETPETLPAEVTAARYGAWIDQQRRDFTWTLVAIIVVVFVLQLVAGMDRSVQRAGLTKIGLHAHDAYRFLTATLMHGGIMHIVMNAFSLFILGMILEALIGGAGVALVFTISALGGSMLSFACSAQTTVGASGGIMGLLGCLIVLGFRFREILPPGYVRRMIYAAVLTLLTGLAARHVIDNAAHAGGLFTGAALGWLLIRRQTALPLHSSELTKWAGYAATALLSAAVPYIAYLFFYS